MTFWNAWPTSFAAEAVLAIYIFALVLAALSDLVSLRIPNWLTGMLALAFPIAALIAAHGAAGHGIDWLSHIEAGAVVFAGAAVLFACRLLGGGDVKLLAAMALWSGLPMVLPLLFLVAIIGGAFALIVLGLRQPLVQASILAVLRRAPAFLHSRMPIPYGIPIAIAGILMAPHLPFLADF
ncbi:MAG TPA: prepilin peptidase [Stellaceae bacterium]|nr:prepilin peptidase [Stellaceae bacterium]